MKKSELRDKIKTLVQQVYKSKSVDLDNGEEITLDADKFPVLTKFPKLKDVIIDLLTDQYEIFMTAIEWVAPRPTTFRSEPTWSSLQPHLRHDPRAPPREDYPSHVHQEDHRW